MPQKDSLFELINSLSPSEKRYFKRFSMLQGENENDYLDLFCLIEKQDAYDETFVVQKLRNPVFAKNLASGKNYLYEMILKSLRSYHAKHKAIFQVYDLLKDIHILMEKNLVEQANKRIRKARKLTSKYHFNIADLEILLLERNLIRAFLKSKSENLIIKNQQSSEENLQQINAQINMVSLYDRIYLTIRNKMSMEDPEGAIRSLLETFSIKNAINALSFDSRMTYHLLWSNYYFAIKNDINNTVIHLKYILDMFDDEPHFIQEYTSRYISVVNNYLTFSFSLKRFDSYDSLLKTLEDIKPSSEILKIKIFQTTHSLKLSAALEQKKYHPALEILPNTVKGLKQYYKKMPMVFQLGIFLYITLIYLHTQNYKEALEWCNRIVHHQKQDIRQDIQSFAKGLQLILHFELENFDLSESLARSLIRAFPSNKEDAMNKILGKSLLKILQQPGSEHRKIWQQLRLNLKSCDPQTNGLEELEHWLNEKR